MGIKFNCPNGHKLNVKTEFAGKRAVCPKCGAKVQVPVDGGTAVIAAPSAAPFANTSTFPGNFSAPAPTSHNSTDFFPPSGNQNQTSPSPALAGNTQPNFSQNLAADPFGQTHVGGPVQGAAMAPVSVAPVSMASSTMAPSRMAPSVSVVSPVAPAPVMAMPDPIAEAPTAVWYLRPPTGGQFGPVAGDVMRGWLAEGRVTPDALIWRAGWPDWRSAGSTFSQLAAPAPPMFPGQGMAAPPIANMPLGQAYGSPMTDGYATGEITEFGYETVQTHTRRRTRKSTDPTVIVTGLLVVLVLALGGILAFILTRNNAPVEAPKPGTPQPKATAPATPDAPAKPAAPANANNEQPVQPQPAEGLPADTNQEPTMETMDSGEMMNN